MSRMGLRMMKELGLNASPNGHLIGRTTNTKFLPNLLVDNCHSYSESCYLLSVTTLLWFTLYKHCNTHMNRTKHILFRIYFSLFKRIDPDL